MQAQRGIPLVGLGMLGFAACDETTGPTGDDFDWSARIAPGDAIEIKGVDSDIIATAAAGNVVTVTAAMEGETDDPADVHIDVITHGGGVTICAAYPDVPGQLPNECAAGDDGYLTTQDNDMTITFWVSVPPGFDLIGKTANGTVRGADLEGDAFAATVNGDVTVYTTQLATAMTVNGNLTVAIGIRHWVHGLLFPTVNGNATVEIPSTSSAEVRLSTANGTISSDFPLTQVAPGDGRGTLGGQFLRLTTVNGNVTLERGP